MKKNNIIAIIPARGGSKGIKNKNLLKINNKSLVQIALKNACSANEINDVYISSDSKKILNQAKKFSKVKMHYRDKKSSDDNASSKDVLKSFSKFKKLINKIVVYIQPSTPLKNSRHIDNSIKIFKKQKKNTLISCYKADSDLNEKIFKSFIKEKKNIKPIYKKNALYTNRQNFKEILIPNGAFFIFKITKNFFNNYISYKNSFGYVMNKDEAIDINNYNDFKRAQKNFRKKIKVSKT